MKPAHVQALQNAQILMKLIDWRRSSSLPLHETDLIIERVCGFDKMRILFDAPKYDLSEEELKTLCSMHDRRFNLNEPLQYIIGYAYFMGLKFKVAPGVLIPRPDTEVLVYASLKSISSVYESSGKCSVLDLCTGSGCIAVSISNELKTLKNLQIAASDISDKALEIASDNARKLASHNIAFINSDLFNNINDNKIDIIVSNPPYIPFSDSDFIDKEVKLYEPHIALFADKNGYYFYEKIAKQAISHLSPGGHIFVETGYNQAFHVAEIFSGLFETEIINDLNGYGRVVHMFSMKKT